MLHSVILAGGSGTRLWPESRQARAKQFLSFETGKSMIQSTAERLCSLLASQKILARSSDRAQCNEAEEAAARAGGSSNNGSNVVRGPIIPAEQTWVLTGRSMRHRIAEALPRVPASQILAEPAARNTAPCIGWAAVKLLHVDPDATMVVLPADHVIRPESVFCETISFAAELVEESPDRLVTLGIKPTFPSTAYGYIQRADALKSAVAEKWRHLAQSFQVLRFHEKPALEQAEAFLKTGEFAWNAGIFVWKARTIYDLLCRFEPEIGELLQKISAFLGTENEQAETDRLFSEMKSISIDYAVMEKAELIVMLEAPFSWNDVGTWCSLDRLYADQKDERGNLAVDAKLLALDSDGCIVRGDNPQHLFALLGLKDVIVVQSADATLIATKEQEESVRNVIEALKEKGWDEFL